jgi:Fe-S-cluster containining protein
VYILSNKFLTQQSDSGNGVFFECIKCGACCRHENILVTVTGRDLAKISMSLGLSSNELLHALDFYILSKNEQPPIGLENIPRVKTERGMAYIALKKLEEGACIFLKDNLCMIHSFRPSACRSFPFVFKMDENTIRWGFSALKNICPGIGTGSEVQTIELLELGLTVIEDLQIYHEFAEDWNHNQKNPTTSSLLDAILEDPRFFA